MKVINWDKIKEGTLLIIKWDDIVSDSSWLKDEVAQEYSPVRCTDVGWFVNDDKLNIRMTSSVNITGEKNISVIPKGIIRDIQKITYKRK